MGNLVKAIRADLHGQELTVLDAAEMSLWVVGNSQK
jgi:hypothetical protein